MFVQVKKKKKKKKKKIVTVGMRNNRNGRLEIPNGSIFLCFCMHVHVVFFTFEVLDALNPCLKSTRTCIFVKRFIYLCSVLNYSRSFLLFEK